MTTVMEKAIPFLTLILVVITLSAPEARASGPDFSMGGPEG